MFSLVAYQSSDESGSDAEEIAGESPSVSKQCDSDGSQLKNSKASSLELPAPAKSKGAVKITVPSLKEFEDEEKEEPSSKKFKKSSGTSLIGLLPPPKYSKLSTQKSFMPYVLTKKQVPSNNTVTSSAHGMSTVKPPKKSMSFSKSVPKEEGHLEKESVATEEDDHSPVRSFFSFEESQPLKPDPNFYSSVNDNEALKPREENSGMNGDVLQASNVSETSSVSTKKNSEPLWQNMVENTFVQHSKSTPTSETYLPDQPLETQCTSSTYGGYPEVVPNTTGYAVDERFLRLQGKRKGQEEINIIDVSVDDQLSDKTQWLTKSITEEKVHRPSRKKNDMPTQLQKRKHQITYLAFQAKEREFELKNQWSQNRLTKRETQAKYGF